MFNLLKKNKPEKKDGVFVVFDIGGTKIRLAVSEDGNNLEETRITETPQQFEDGINKIAELTQEALGGRNLKAVCGGLPGVLDEEKETLFRAPNLPLWEDKFIRAELEDVFQTKVILKNDSALAGLGEAVFGAGKGFNIVAYFTVSTGIGGSRIVNGEIEASSSGFEPGHQIINVGALSQEGRGELENLVSGRAIEKRYERKPKDIINISVREELAKFLAVGLHNSILHWSPDVVVLGGPLIVGESPIPIEVIRDQLDKLLNMFPEVPPVKKAILGDRAALYGALKTLKK